MDNNYPWGCAPGSERAGVGEATEGLPLHCTLGLPLLEVPQGDCAGGVLHPLDHLQQGSGGAGGHEERKRKRKGCMKPLTAPGDFPMVSWDSPLV